MELLKFPDPALLTICKEVPTFDSYLKDNLKRMWKIMLDHDGMGLSANQVGILHRYFIMIGPEMEMLNIIDPVVKWVSDQTIFSNEGCLSAPGEIIPVKRAEAISILHKDENGVEWQRNFVGLHAICVQHEMDHLDGKSFLLDPSLDLTMGKVAKKKLVKKWGLSLK